MPSQYEPENKPDQSLTSNDSDDNEKNQVGIFKALLIAIAGVELFLSIWVLLPMFLTYLSEGDVRPPSQIHPTDSEVRQSQNPYTPTKPEK